MTKEELEKEADKWLVNNLHSTEEDYKQAYLAGAEPREKRIAELEKENAKLKVENAFCEKACEGATMMYKQLTKATKLIRSLYNSCCSYGATGKATTEAEQFLKELEQ